MRRRAGNASGWGVTKVATQRLCPSRTPSQHRTSDVAPVVLAPASGAFRARASPGAQSGTREKRWQATHAIQTPHVAEPRGVRRRAAEWGQQRWPGIGKDRHERAQLRRAHAHAAAETGAGGAPHEIRRPRLLDSRSSPRGTRRPPEACARRSPPHDRLPESPGKERPGPSRSLDQGQRPAPRDQDRDGSGSAISPAREHVTTNRLVFALLRIHRCGQQRGA